MSAASIAAEVVGVGGQRYGFLNKPLAAGS